MKKVFLLFVILVGFCMKTQSQNTVWYFGAANALTTSYGLDFTGVTPSSGTPIQRNFEGSLDYYESVSVVSNNTGEVLYYTDGIEVYDASHNQMAGSPSPGGVLNGTQDGNSGSSVQGAYSLLKPGSQTEYYLFTSQAIDGVASGLRVNRIDMTRPGNGTVANPLGELMSTDSLLRNTGTEMMTAYGTCGTDTVWVITHAPNSWDFVRVLVTSNGIQSVETQTLETPRAFGAGFAGGLGRGSMDINDHGTMLVFTGSNPIGTHLLEFNRHTGMLSNPTELRAPNNLPYDGYGCEFSPDGTKIYFTHNQVPGMWQFDITTGLSHDVPNSNLNHGEIITGIDNKLYVGKVSQEAKMTVGLIENPNSAGPSVVYDSEAITFPSTSMGSISYAMPQGFYCPLNACNIDMVLDQCDTVAPFQLTATPEGGTFGGGAYVTSAGMFDAAAAGEGTHWVTYDNGCEKPDSIQITVNTCVPPCLDTTLSNTIAPICVDETADLTSYEVTSDAGTWSIVNTPSGSSPATITGESIFDANGADAGTYRIRFTLEGSPLENCPDSAERNIVVNEKPVLALTGGEFCAGDSLELDAGNPGATYQWSNGGTGQTEYFSTVGPHKVIVTLSGCVDSAEVSLTVNENPNVSITAPSASCDNDSPENLIATPEGGQWYINDIVVPDPAQFNPSSLGDGSHEIKYEVTNVNGCSDVDSISHLINAAPEITNMPSTAFLCASQSAITLSADPVGGQWYIDDIASSDQFDPGVLGLGDHEVKYVVSSGACSDSDMITIFVNDAPDVVIDPIVSSCDNQEIETLNATPEGGQWYVNNVLSSNQFNPAALGADTYNVKYVFSNGSGCSDSDSVSVAINVAPTVDLGPSTFFCTGDSVSLDAGPGYSDYDWSTGGSSQVIFVSSPGPVTVVVTDPNGCTGTDQVQVSANELPSVDLGGSIIVCEQDSITLDATHPDAFSYTWLPTNETTPTIRVGSEDSTYSVTIVDNDGCEFTDSVEISQEILPTVDLGSDTIICDNVTTILDAVSNPDVSYTWLLDRVVLPGETSQTLEADSGEYIVRVSTENGCESSDTINIDNHQLPNITLDAEYEFCQFDSVQIDLGSIGVSYVWSTGDSTESIWAKSSGTISVQVTDANSCVVSGNADIIENLIPAVNLGGNDSACTGLEIELDATVSGGVTYVWSDGEIGPIYNLVGPDTLSVIVTDDKGCVGYDTIEIKSLDSLDLSFMEPENQVCFGSEADNPLNGGDFEDAQYTWTLPDGNTESGQTIVPLLNGWYVVDITDKFNCKGQDSILNVVIPLPNIDLGPDTSFCSLGQETYTVRMNFSENVAGVISWEDDFGNTDNNNSNDTLFTATTAPVLIEGIFVDDASGCSHKDSIYLEEECEETILTFPNIFVPNGSNNTSFRPIELTDDVLQKLLNNILWSEFEVYNRWGIRVFQSQNTLPRWKGLFENRPVPTGTYYWIYRYKDSSVKIHSLNGFVQVLHD